jgi:hypothetical protein
MSRNLPPRARLASWTAQGKFRFSFSTTVGRLPYVQFAVTELIFLNAVLVSLFMWCPHVTCELVYDVSATNISVKRQLIGFPNNFTVRRDVNS